MADFVEVVAAGPGWTQVRDENGDVYTLTGSRNWRNNNPGNLEFGPFAQQHGAIGSDGRFAVFPDYETGRAAKENLLFGSPSYAGKTIESAISRYAPPSENDTSAYLNAITSAVGVPAGTPLSSLTPQQRQSMLDAMQRVEGYRPGQIAPLPPMDIPQVATQLDMTPPPMPAQSNLPPLPADAFQRITARNNAALGVRPPLPVAPMAELPPIPAPRLDRPTSFFPGHDLPGLLGTIQKFSKAMNNASGPFNNGADNLLYQTMRGGNFTAPGAATHVGTNGFLYAPKPGGGFINVGRAPNFAQQQSSGGTPGFSSGGGHRFNSETNEWERDLS